MKGKKGYTIGVSIIILLFGLWVIKNFKYRYNNNMLLNPDKLTGLKHAPQKEKRNAVEVGFIEINGEKAKVPSFKFINQDRDTITEKDYKGKVYLVEFFYTSCPTICPIMNDNLLEIAEEYKGNKRFGIASFSIDSYNDTPEELKAYAERTGIDQHPNWNLMTGEQTDIYNLAQNDFKLIAQDDQNEPGGILHDGLFVLVDQNGYIRSRKDDFGNPLIYYRGYIERDAQPEFGVEEPQINELIEDIKELLHE